MKFGALKQDEYFEQDGDLYQKLSDGMKGKKARHIKTKTIVDIPLLSPVIRASAPPPRTVKPRPVFAEPDNQVKEKTSDKKNKDIDKDNSGDTDD